MAKILIVEDDRFLAKMLLDFLTVEKHAVDTVYTGTDGLEYLRQYNYDLVILDWDLPETDGISVCKEYRNCGGKSPILFLTGKRSISEKEIGFDSGADDYLTKPFNIRELSARVKALLRRPAQLHTSSLAWADIVLEPGAGRVFKDGQEIKLVPKDFALLEFLMRHPDQLFSAEALLDRVWASNSEATAGAVTSSIKRIRKLLDTEGRESIITTVHGLGYRLGGSK